MKYKRGEINEFVGAVLGTVAQKAIEWPLRTIGGAVKGTVVGGRHVVKGAKDGMTSELDPPKKSRAEKKFKKGSLPKASKTEET
jgi:hypothetical protein